MDRDLAGPDHHFSSTPEELTTLVERVRCAETALGDAEICPAGSEMPGRRAFRLSCRAARPLGAGAVIQPDDVAISRPGDGFPPRELESVIGRRLARSLEAGEPFLPDAIEENS